MNRELVGSPPSTSLMPQFTAESVGAFKTHFLFLQRHRAYVCVCVNPNKGMEQVVCAASRALLDACTAPWQFSVNCLTRALCWVRSELSECSDHCICRAFLCNFCANTLSTHTSSSSLHREQSKYIVIFAELVRSGQGKAETERSRLVWAIQSLQEESAACVSSPLPLLQTQMGKTGGGGRRGKDKVRDRRSKICYCSKSIVRASEIF